MNFEDLYCVKLFERTEDSVLLEILVPEACPYFDGHFPGFSLLPAVAQVELAIRFASEYLAAGADIIEIRRLKFSRIIRPNMSLMLRLTKNDNIVSFRMFSCENEDIYSSGIILVSL